MLRTTVFKVHNKVIQALLRLALVSAILVHNKVKQTLHVLIYKIRLQISNTTYHSNV